MILVYADDSRPCSFGEALRASSENRERYFEQSRRTEAGRLGELPPEDNRLIKAIRDEQF